MRLDRWALGECQPVAVSTTARGSRTVKRALPLVLATLWIVPGCSSDEAPKSDIIIYENGVHGPQRVPAGSSARAESPGGATIESNDTGAAVVVETAPGKTTVVSGLNIRARGGVGLLVVGEGNFVGENLDIECATGICVAAEATNRFELTDSVVYGTVTEASIPNLVFPLPADQAPVVGIALARIGEAIVSNVDVYGFGGFGAISVATNATWNGGSISRNVGVGFMQEQGTATLDGVTVEQTWNSEIGTGVLSFGAVVTNQGLLRTRNALFGNNEGWGVVQSDASSDHTDIEVRDNKNIGLWVQDSIGSADQPALRVTGSSSWFHGNLGGGIFMLNSGFVELRDLRASSSILRTVATSDMSVEEMADGLQITDLQGDLTLRDVTLADNERIGLLITGAPPQSAAIDIGGVSITGDGQLGMITQAGFPAPASSAVVRDPTLEAADDAQVDPVSIALELGVIVSVAAIRDVGLIGEDALVLPDGSTGNVVVEKSGLIVSN